MHTTLQWTPCYSMVSSAGMYSAAGAHLIWSSFLTSLLVRNSSSRSTSIAIRSFSAVTCFYRHTTAQNTVKRRIPPSPPSGKSKDRFGKQEVYGDGFKGKAKVRNQRQRSSNDRHGFEWKDFLPATAAIQTLSLGLRVRAAALFRCDELPGIAAHLNFVCLSA